MTVSLQVRILRAFGLLFVSLLLGSLYLVDLHVTGQVQKTAEEELEISRRVFEEVLATRARGLIHAASAAAEHPLLQSAARSWAPPIVDAAFKRINALVGSQVVILTDRKGVILARSDRKWQVGEIFDEAPSVARALGGERHASMWAQFGQLYQMVSVPLRASSGPAGTLSVGFRVDETLAREIAALTGSTVVFFVGDRAIASSRGLAANETATVAALVASLRGSTPRTGRIDLRSGEPAIVARAFPGFDASVGAYALLRSLDAGVAELRSLEQRLFAIGAAALLAALGLGFLISRSLSRPLAELATAAQELGRGDYDAPIPSAPRTVEIDDLTHAFETMRRSLRARERELQGFTAGLEKVVTERTRRLEEALADNRELLERLQRANDELEERVDERGRELEQTQRALVRQERMAAIGRLAAGVAHEINNPLGVLSGFAEGLLDRSRDEQLREQEAFADFPEYLEMIEGEVERLKGIVQRFLDFSRTRTPKRTELDLNEVGRRVTSLLANHAQTEGKAIDESWSPAPLHAEADREQIHQVILNLLLNALDAVERGGRVAVGSVDAGDACELWVEDDGPGIGEDIRDRVFDPFFSTKPAEEGTGLGLSLCQDLVGQNRGSIDLVDRPDGLRGARFRIRFPKA